MQVDIHLIEPQGIRVINAEYAGRDKADGVHVKTDFVNLDNTIRRPDRNRENRAHVHYRPTRDEQLDFSTKGVDGDFIVTYDLTRTSGGSHSQVHVDFVLFHGQGY